MQKLLREFYNRDTTTVAKELLGHYLVHRVDGREYIGKIVEVEAYLGQHDLACHTSKGLTKRTSIMFGPAGYAYIYMIYGMYYCFNVVTEGEGQGSAILIRALEPIQQIELRTQGPGLLCRAMHIDKQLNGHDMSSDNFYICKPVEEEKFTIVARPRIGVAYAQEWAKELLRFYIEGNSFVSKV